MVTQLSEAQQYFLNLVVAARGDFLSASFFCVLLLCVSSNVSLSCGLVVLLPKIQNDDAKARIQEVAATVKKMHGALGVAMGTLFCGDPDLCSDLRTVFALLGRSLQKMED